MTGPELPEHPSRIELQREHYKRMAEGMADINAQPEPRKPTPAEREALSLYADGFTKGYERGHEVCAAERREAWARDKLSLGHAVAFSFGIGFGLAAVLALLGVL